MNAAFLLVTMAGIAGADTAAPATPPPAAAPVHSAPAAVYGGGCATCGGCSTGGCDSCCESGGGFFAKFRGRFHHSSDCGCDVGCGCDTCGHGGGLREKLRGLFHRGHDDCGCCDTGCATCGGCGGVISGGTISPVPGGGTMKAEPIGPPKEAPKKLPAGGEEKKGGSVQLIPQPIGTPVLQVAPTSGKSPF